MQSEKQAAEATVDDHLRNLIQLMKRGGRISVTDIPNDPTFLSSHFGGETVRAMADRLEAALSAAEPVSFEGQNYNCPCVHPSQCDESCLKPAPSVAAKAAWVAKAAVLRSRGKNNTLHDINQAADYLDAAALSAQVQNLAAKSLADAYQKYLDASGLYNERLAISKTKALGTMRVDEEYRAIDEARRAFDKLAVDIAKSALPAAPAKQEG